MTDIVKMIEKKRNGIRKSGPVQSEMGVVLDSMFSDVDTLLRLQNQAESASDSLASDDSTQSKVYAVRYKIDSVKEALRDLEEALLDVEDASFEY